ncbi:NAD(P)-dependent oxidoreductase [Dyadobacter sp. CY326]|uniref:NAD(P)-dependent oxidoreductase n=1 Tax=Dyadobacter sp. CY326 TaxID=2907300 RepID=UPI001F2ECA4D|nr:NAD(P)H-binding protein [Dyadobacter sp. CY326]MCE7065132.1 NAD(P)H-binding protein [Dyadobacter sp. CY326]
MNQNIKIAIVGGGGRTGKYLVTQLIEKGYSIKVLLRKPETFEIKSPLIQVVQGDAIDFAAVSELIAGCQAVISTIGQRPGEPLVAEHATKNILEAMSMYRISRYILVAGINIDTPFDKKGPQTISATDWMKANYPTIQEDRQKAYTLLTESDIKWTLVRVPFINFSRGTGDIGVNVDDCLGNSIDAGNIATFLIEQILDTTYLNKAPFIWNS